MIAVAGFAMRMAMKNVVAIRKKSPAVLVIYYAGNLLVMPNTRAANRVAFVMCDEQKLGTYLGIFQHDTPSEIKKAIRLALAKHGIGSDGEERPGIESHGVSE